MKAWKWHGEGIEKAWKRHREGIMKAWKYEGKGMVGYGLGMKRGACNNDKGNS